MSSVTSQMKIVYTGTNYRRQRNLEGTEEKETLNDLLGGLFRPTNKRRNKIPKMNGQLHNQ